MRARDEASKALKSVGSSLSGLQKNLRTVGTVAMAGAGLVAGAMGGISVAVTDMAVQAAPLQQVEQAFGGLAESAGSGTDQMLAALQRGSSGMISNRDLMLSFNKASQLVSTDFAVQLPDAMQYLGKVAGATGEDLDYLLDSLVTGVGRLSPMILDNLSIQTDLTAANVAYAESIGKNVNELTKQEQQAALMAQVLDQLEVNTAAMPDATGSAAEGLAQLRATFQNIKDEIGTAFIPVLSELVSSALPAIQAIMPPVIEALTRFAAAIQPVASAIGSFIERIATGTAPLDAFKILLMDLLPSELFAGFLQIILSVEQFITKAQEVLQPIMTWIQENVKLQDVLLALGVAVATIVIPAVASIVAAMAPVIATFVLVVAAVAALRQAWETNFLGIRDKAQAVWSFLQQYVPMAVEAIRAFVTTAIQMIRDSWATNGDQILAKAQAIWTAIQTAISTAITVIQTVIQTTVSAIQSVWQAHGQTISRVAQTTWDTIKTWIQTSITVITSVIKAFTAAIRGDWTAFGEHLRTATDAIWNNIQTIFQNAVSNIITVVSHLVQQIGSTFRNTDWGAVGRAVIDGIARGISGGVGAITSAARNAARAALDAAKGFLGIHSPSSVAGKQIGEPFTEGVAEHIIGGLPQLARAAREVGDTLVGQGTVGQLPGAPRMVPAMAGGPSMSVVIHNHFGRGSVRSDDDIDEITQRQQEMLHLRGVRTFEV